MFLDGNDIFGSLDRIPKTTVLLREEALHGFHLARLG
jgi:hypothetical protein